MPAAWLQPPCAPASSPSVVAQISCKGEVLNISAAHRLDMECMPGHAQHTTTALRLPRRCSRGRRCPAAAAAAQRCPHPLLQISLLASHRLLDGLEVGLELRQRDLGKRASGGHRRLDLGGDCKGWDGRGREGCRGLRQGTRSGWECRQRSGPALHLLAHDGLGLDPCPLPPAARSMSAALGRGLVGALGGAACCTTAVPPASAAAEGGATPAGAAATAAAIAATVEAGAWGSAAAPTATLAEGVGAAATAAAALARLTPVGGLAAAGRFWAPAALPALPAAFLGAAAGVLPAIFLKAGARGWPPPAAAAACRSASGCLPTPEALPAAVAGVALLDRAPTGRSASACSCFALSNAACRLAATGANCRRRRCCTPAPPSPALKSARLNSAPSWAARSTGLLPLLPSCLVSAGLLASSASSCRAVVKVSGGGGGASGAAARPLGAGTPSGHQSWAVADTRSLSPRNLKGVACRSSAEVGCKWTDAREKDGVLPSPGAHQGTAHDPRPASAASSTCPPPTSQPRQHRLHRRGRAAAGQGFQAKGPQHAAGRVGE